MPRVRSSNSAIGTLIRDATERSTTFRRLVEIIDASDGLVYVDAGRCRHGVGACLVNVTAAGNNRILRVVVQPQKDDADLMGLIGHELRHAIEVIEDPTVTSTVAMYFFYRRQGTPRGNSFETDAAVDAGMAVRAEVRRSLRAAQGR
jgi:hypothetical protein